VEREMCVCIGGAALEPVLCRPDGSAVLCSTGLSLSAAELSVCVERYQGRVLGFDAQRALDLLHVFSAGAVSFARGLNDTPKIVALLLASTALGTNLGTSMALVGIAMAVGGVLNASRIARTMSERITEMNHGQGFTANLTTAVLVLFASRFGMPVSTTHVSCGSLIGIGAATGGARWGMIRRILAAWVATLPVAALLSSVVFLLAR